MTLNFAILYFLIGIILITIIDTLGAISSRKLNFKYAYLSIFSFAVYTGVGYLTSRQYGIEMSLIVNSILGLYDGTIGFRLSIILRANNGIDMQEAKKLLTAKTALTMLSIACLLAFLGFLLTKC